MRFHVVREKFVSGQPEKSFNDTWGVQNAFLFQVFNESLPLGLFHSAHQRIVAASALFNVFEFERKMTVHEMFYFTVTDLARFLGMSGLYPLSMET